jgi:hypothetical protein
MGPIVEYSTIFTRRILKANYFEIVIIYEVRLASYGHDV